MVNAPRWTDEWVSKLYCFTAIEGRLAAQIAHPRNSLQCPAEKVGVRGRSVSRRMQVIPPTPPPHGEPAGYPARRPRRPAWPGWALFPAQYRPNDVLRRERRSVVMRVGN